MFFSSDSRPILLRRTNMKDNAETPVNKGSPKNRNSRASSDSGVPILSEESELFGARLREVIGKESVRSFAAKCGLSDSLVNAYIKGQKEPGLVNLLKMSLVGGVLVDWLATGRPPKTRAEQAALARQAAGQPPLDRARLHLALTMAEDAVRLITEPVTPERRADLVLAFYDRLGANNDKP